MSDHTEAVEHVGGTTVTFLYVWVALLVMTGVEVLLAYEQVPTLIMLTAPSLLPDEVAHEAKG